MEKLTIVKVESNRFWTSTPWALGPFELSTVGEFKVGDFIYWDGSIGEWFKILPRKGS